MNMKNDNADSLFEKSIKRGIEKEYISLSEDKGKVTYRCFEKTLAHI